MNIKKNITNTISFCTPIKIHFCLIFRLFFQEQEIYNGSCIICLYFILYLCQGSLDPRKLKCMKFFKIKFLANSYNNNLQLLHNSYNEAVNYSNIIQLTAIVSISCFRC